jgi:hypothetical protein
LKIEGASDDKKTSILIEGGAKRKCTKVVINVFIKGKYKKSVVLVIDVMTDKYKYDKNMKNDPEKYVRNSYGFIKHFDCLDILKKEIEEKMDNMS